MSALLCQGSLLKCSFGLAPGALSVLPQNKVNTCSLAAANIMSNVPMENIPSFGMCHSPANPAVIAATAAALGTLTPMPCVPMTTAPWTPGSTQVTIANMPIITQDSKCMCTWGGIIETTMPAQATVTTSG